MTPAPSPASDRRPRHRRETRVRARLNDRIRADVVQRYEAGASSRTIAADLGLGKATVLKILADAGVQMRPSHVRY